MSDASLAAHAPHLIESATAALGSGTVFTRVRRLRGGTKKGVFRLTSPCGASVVAYLWSARENHWPAREREEDPGRTPFGHADGVDLFTTAVEHLERAGVRVPRVYLVQRAHPGLGGDVAIVEDVPGATLEELIAQGGRERVVGVLDRLRTALEAMAARTRAAPGRVGHPLAVGRGCVDVVWERARADLEEGARRRPELARVRDRAARLLDASASRVEPRERHGLVHGELGPDHVLVDASGAPVLIDVEGLMFFDVEWEHAFLSLRFGAWYGRLRTPGLDPFRSELYMLAHRLSLVAGPLWLLDGDTPDRGVMLDIVEHNLAWMVRRVG
ncbi:phosphotransferase [Nocardiopsis sp. MG754419]|uniref:phosphotransferase family protein n=1 Tax=Nocardiopsis sp. MG754419 TaxID=2259865 RepID=UPI0027DB73ED|nr:phosphotransferase [Nocardiopsis sp. MG754419]